MIFSTEIGTTLKTMSGLPAITMNDLGGAAITGVAVSLLGQGIIFPTGMPITTSITLVAGVLAVNLGSKWVLEQFWPMK